MYAKDKNTCQISAMNLTKNSFNGQVAIDILMGVFQFICLVNKPERNCFLKTGDEDGSVMKETTDKDLEK